MFAPSARQQAADLEAQLDQLFSVYAGPADAIGWDGLCAMEGNYDHGKHRKTASSNFPVRSGDTYYWCYLRLLYENTLDDGGTGILQLDFYTAAERCAFEYSEGKIVDHPGLTVHADAAQEGEIRCISGHPYLYTPSAEPLAPEAVKSFLETCASFYSFQKQFGAPNAENIFHYYQLPAENGEPRYLQLSVHQDAICSATVVNEFEYLQTLWSNSDENEKNKAS